MHLENRLLNCKVLTPRRVLYAFFYEKIVYFGPAEGSVAHYFDLKSVIFEKKIFEFFFSVTSLIC